MLPRFCQRPLEQSPPLVHASKPPGTWQSYDIHFKAPVFQDGKLAEAAYVSLYHNNVLVQDNARFLGATVWRKVARYRPHGAKGPFSLQAHGNPVRYRNIWVRPLEKTLGKDAN